MTRQIHKQGVWAFTLFAAISLILALARCTTLPPSSTPGPVSSPTPVPENASTPLVGWPADYDAFIERTVPDSLLSYEPNSFCPGYTRLKDRRKFWSALFKSIASPESGFKRTERFREPGMTDKQGRQVYSEGLLQLSMQDADNYRTPWCQKLSRANNGSKADTDPTRPIFDPYVNLGCGIEIADKLTRNFPNVNFADAMGKYWSTIRPAKGKVQAYFKAHFKGLCE